MSQVYFSPLRYPGGKASLFDFISKVIVDNNLSDGVYAEAFAGGAGVALKLLMLEYVGDIVINDKDPLIFNFWKSVLEENEALCKLINDTPVTIDEWTRRCDIVKNKESWKNTSSLELGFTAFFLNRCNRSGILKGGVIGGKEQSGKWKLDARFNKKDLIKRIYKIGFYSDRIKLYNLDAKYFIRKLYSNTRYDNLKILLYLDPPYVKNGKDLYLEYFSEKDHISFSRLIHAIDTLRWIISYDDLPLIHNLYKHSNRNVIEFNYFANRTKLGKELIISSSNCILPESYLHYSKIKSIKEQEIQTRIANVV